MLYLIQKNTFKPVNYESLINSLIFLGYEYQIVQSLPFTDDIFEEDGETILKTDRKDIFPFGAVKLAKISKKCDWNPGSQLNDKHDYNYYKDYYKDNLLNWDSEIIKFGDTNYDFIGAKFIRPCKDSKVFTGKIFKLNEWFMFRDNSLNNGHETVLDKDTLVQVASPKTIYKEVRCWVIGGKVITSAVYFGLSIELKETEAEEFAQSMVNIHSIADAFVMDVCLTPEGWKIVELNCINWSGFYGSNTDLILFELNEYFLITQTPRL